MIKNLSFEERICESFFANSLEETLHALNRVTAFGELRYDLCSLKIIDLAIIKKQFNKPLIFTCRGGKIKEEKRLQVYKKAIQVGFEYIDLDITNDANILHQILPYVQSSNCKLILSFHNYHKTPLLNDLQVIINQAKVHKPDIIKIATHLHTESDISRLMNIQEKNGNSICFGMGKYASKSRVESLLRGALFTYVALDTHSITAPGQVNSTTLKKEYEEQVLEKDFRLAVLGNPIAHSKSPDIFKHLFQQSGQSGVYEKLELENIEELVSIKNKYIGFNITAPFKQTIIQYLDDISNAAKSIGAVNTIYRKEGLWLGDNTDYLGILKAIKTNSDFLMNENKNCLIIGAGGAARAAIYALNQLNISPDIINRTASKAVVLAKEFHVQAVDVAQIELKNYRLIVNTVPFPFSLINHEQLQSHHIVLDAIYPLSPFSEYCIISGFNLIEGEKWLWYQAVSAFEIFQKNL